MTTVWVLTQYWDTTGEAVVGVYATADEAKAAHPHATWETRPAGGWHTRDHWHARGNGAGYLVSPHTVAATDQLAALRAEVEALASRVDWRSPGYDSSQTLNEDHAGIYMAACEDVLDLIDKHAREGQ